MMLSLVLTMATAGVVIAGLPEKRRLVTALDFGNVNVTVTKASAGCEAWAGWHYSHAPATPTIANTATATAIALSASLLSVQASADSSEWVTDMLSSATPAPSGPVSSYAQAILDAHNSHRVNHSVSDLTWSDNMAWIAQQIAASCIYAHNTHAGGGGYGQNIGAGTNDSQVPAMITNEMYDDEINYYPLPYGVEPDMGNFEKWGHYSQIVWKSTNQVGCYTQFCSGGLANVGIGVSPYFTVCNYSPAGNVGGEYAANVQKPNGMPSITL